MRLHEINEIISRSDGVPVSLRTLIEFHHLHICDSKLCYVVCLVSSFLCRFWRSESFVHVSIGRSFDLL